MYVHSCTKKNSYFTKSLQNKKIFRFNIQVGDKYLKTRLLYYLLTLKSPEEPLNLIPSPKAHRERRESEPCLPLLPPFPFLPSTLNPFLSAFPAPPPFSHLPSPSNSTPSSLPPPSNAPPPPPNTRRVSPETSPYHRISRWRKTTCSPTMILLPRRRKSAAPPSPPTSNSSSVTFPSMWIALSSLSCLRAPGLLRWLRYN